jgi:Domain of unknown function (DUF4372)
MRSNAVPHQNSVFHDLLKLVPWGEFERLVERHGADDAARRLKAKGHLIALLYGQLAGATSLREIVGGLESQAAGLYHLGGSVVKRSTLAEANAQRPSAVFSGLLGSLMKQAHRRLRQEVGECVYLIDSTSVRLTELSARWARFSDGVCGAKAHVIYDPDADCPIYAEVTPSRVNDVNAAQAMPIEPGATYPGLCTRQGVAGTGITENQRLTDKVISGSGAFISSQDHVSVSSNGR